MRYRMRYNKLIELVPNNTFGYDDKFKSFDDTFIEKLNYRYTVVLILAFAYLVTSKQVNGARKNIECFVPAHLHLNNVSYTDYINEYCYLSLTYHIPHDEHLVRQATTTTTTSGDDAKKVVNNNEIKYYQLTHYFLIIISIFIYIPRMCYSTLTRLYDIDLKSLMDAILQLKFITSSHNSGMNKVPIVAYIIHYMDIYLSKSLACRREHADGNCCSCACFCIIKSNRGNMRANSNLLKVFCLVKVLYISNLLISIKFLNYLLGNDFYTLFGFTYLRKLVSVSSASPVAAVPFLGSLNMDTYFPKVTLCDVHIRELGYHPKFHKIYTIQCALPINLYNEQVFIFLWFWLLLMCIVNMIDLVAWSFLYIPAMRRNFFCKYNINLDSYKEAAVSPSDDDDETTTTKQQSDVNLNDFFYSNLFNQFLYNYLSIDGVFIFKLISKNFGDFIANDLLHELILKYLLMVERRKKENGKVAAAATTIAYCHQPSSSPISCVLLHSPPTSSPDCDFI